MNKLLITSTLILLFSSIAFTQVGNVGIGTSTPDVSAKLEINTNADGTNTKKGFLMPQISLATTTDGAPFSSLSPTGPATGLLVYNTNASITGVGANGVGFYYNSGTKAAPLWVRVLNNLNAWLTKGNTGNTTPAIPATYGTTAIGASENWLGNADGRDLVFGTNNIERMRLKYSGSFAFGTANNTGGAPPYDTVFSISIHPYKNAQRGGIYMQYPGSGTVTSSAYGIDIDVATNSNQNIRGFRFRSGTTGSGVFYGTGAELTSLNIVSGYTAYRNGSGLSFGIYGINGTNAAYATNANAWALWSQGRAVISSETSPTSPLGVDLEIRNTSTGPRNPPATLSMRNTIQIATIGDTLGRIYFGDNYQTAAQSEIRVIRDDAASSIADLPTAMTFFTIPNAGNTLTERVRIANTGNVIIGTGEASATTTGNTLRGPNRTGTNAAGVDLSIAAGNGTGTGGSGNLLFFTSPVAASSATANTVTERMRINNAGKVGINKSPAMRLDVTDASTTADDATIMGAATGAARTYGVLGTTTSTTTNASGVKGIASGATGSGNGVWGTSASTTGTGVYGSATATTGTGVLGYATAATTATSGVIGLVESPTGAGVYGENLAASGTSTGFGVYGLTNQSGAQASGVLGENLNANGDGLYGVNLAASGTGDGAGTVGFTTQSGTLAAGTWGQTFNAAGRGIVGTTAGATAGTSTGIGVEGVSNQDAGFGVYGVNTRTTGTGIVGTGGSRASFHYADGAGATLIGTTVGVNGSANSTTAGTDRFGGYFENTALGTGLYAYVGGRDNANVDRKIIGTGSVSTIVSDLEGKKRAMTCPEAPEILFMDYGTGKLQNGFVHIDIDPILTKNIYVDDKHPLRVFVQLKGNCNGVYVTNETANGFDVYELNNGTSNTAFNYQIVANRADEVYGDGTVSPNSSQRFTYAPEQKKIVEESVKKPVEIAKPMMTDKKSFKKELKVSE